MSAVGAGGADDDDVPPGFESSKTATPNGTPAAAPPTTSAPNGEAAAEELAEELLRSAKVTGEEPDEPDPSLRLQEGLRERPEAQITTQSETIYASATTFEELPLSPEILQGLYVEMKFERPSKIQAMTLPMILTPPYKDLIAQAHNGSGKTTCFVLSMLSRVDPKLRKPQALCICPTRELVVQNLNVLLRMSKFTEIKATSTASEVDGASFRREPITEQIVIGAHGKLKAWSTKRILSLDNIVILVYDEADEMLKNDGFGDDSVRLIKAIRKQNPQVQLLLFSATFNEQIKRFAMQIAPRANHLFVAKEELSLDVIAQYNVTCPTPDAKVRVLKEMIFPNCEKLGQTIIFVRTQVAARELWKAMDKDGYKCTCIEGGMDRGDRDRVVQEFRDGITKILISTDVLSRGFDVSQVTLVVNFDVPVERDGRNPAYETYLHRIGRSGRFGRKGAAFNLVCGHEETRIINSISSYFNKRIEDLAWDDEDKFVEVLNKSM